MKHSHPHYNPSSTRLHPMPPQGGAQHETTMKQGLTTILPRNTPLFRQKNKNTPPLCDPPADVAPTLHAGSLSVNTPTPFASNWHRGTITLGDGAVGTKTQFSILSVVMLVLCMVASPVAEAQRGRSVGKAASRAIRSGASIGKVPAIRGAQGLSNLSRATRHQSSPFPLLDAISRAGSGGRNTGFPILDAISRASNGGNYPSTPFPILEALSRIDDDHNDRSDAEKFLYGLSQLGGYGGGYGYGPGYGGYGYPGGYGGDPLYPYFNSYNHHKSQEDYADAMRDAAIAGAVGNVVSAIVQSPAITGQTPVYVQRQPVYTQPAPIYTQPAPAPTYVQPSPLGRYETRREVVGGGYYEREQVWMPESRDPQSGNIVEGHYVTVKKWVPEVVQETRVWVAP